MACSAVIMGALGLPDSSGEESPKASTTKPGKDWEAAIVAFEAEDKEAPPPKGAVLFTGASNITRWKTLKADFPGHTVINRGFGGSRISDAVRYVDRVVIPHAPRVVVIQAGGNDLVAGRPIEEIVADVKTFAEKVRAALPGTRICYLGIPASPSRWPVREKCLRANALIKEYTEKQANMRFIDCWTPMLSEAGEPRPELFRPDRLHNSEEGYKIYVNLIQPFLDEK